MGLCRIDNFSPDQRNGFFINAFELAAVCRSVQIVNAIAGLAAAGHSNHGSGLETGSMSSSRRCNKRQDIETVEAPFAALLVRPCIVRDFRDPIALLPDHHPVFLAPTDNHGVSVLNDAVRYGHLDLVDLLLQKGAVGAAANDTLCVAASNTPSLIPRFLALGADPNGAHGTTKPLHAAAGAGCVDAVRMLLDAGARVDDLDGFGRTPLFVACDRYSIEVVRLLLDAGAHPKFVRETTGETVLHVATENVRRFDNDGEYTDVEILKIVLERVPFFAERFDNDGRSPLMVADSLGGEGAVEARRLLINPGAKR
ncbi:hypothetical protein HDU96_005780 [Phlyctochytrium bullatum]|nr:hypothetical protein HDU96_005780 [Phlyctochytrium bullatum]